MSEGKKKANKPPPISIGGSESQVADSTDGGFISGVGSVDEYVNSLSLSLASISLGLRFIIVNDYDVG